MLWRTPHRDSKPGVVKIEFPSTDLKIQALKKKRALKSQQNYNKVYIRAAQTHEERLIHLNTRVLLKELNLDEKFRTTGSGRLVAKEE